VAGGKLAVLPPFLYNESTCAAPTYAIADNCNPTLSGFGSAGPRLCWALAMPGRGTVAP
jgi:hypothetical protein